MPFGPISRGVRALAVLSLVLVAWAATRELPRWHQNPFGDFNYLHSGSQCLLYRCNPYDFASLDALAAIHHEDKPHVLPEAPVYPPSTLVVLLPFALMGWPTAALAFDALAGIAAALACLLMVWRLRIPLLSPAALLLLALPLSRPFAAALEFANPTLLTAALLTLACVMLLDAPASTPGWLLLGLSLALKPQLAAAAVVVLLCKRDTRAAALKAGIFAALLLLAGLLAYRIRLGSYHYLDSLFWTLRHATLQGGSSDYTNVDSFDFLNLQTALAAITHAGRSTVNALAWIIATALAAATAWFAARRNTLTTRPWTMLALATAISLLPVYHRGYDRVVVLLLIPAAVELAAASKRLALLYAALAVVWLMNDTVFAHILKRLHYTPQNGVDSVLLCAVLLWSLATLRSRGRRTLPLDSIGT